MKKEQYNNILDRPGHPDGRTVPAGYFEAFAAEMSAKLPVNDLEQQPARNAMRPTTWQRIRPFVYMAAMFAGVWCMMKMFTMIQNTANNTQLQSNEILSAAMANDEFVYDYVLNSYSEGILLDELYDDGVQVTEVSI